MSGNIEEATFENIKEEIYSCLKFVSEEQIPFDFWHNAIPIVRDIDMDDIAFVALSEYLDARLWTGDKKLSKGMEKHGFNRGISTEELSQMSFLQE